MADFDATRTPQDVVAVIGAPRDVALRYRLQNVDSNAVLFMRETDTAPTGTERSHVVGPGEFFDFRVFADGPAASFGWWGWTRLAECRCVVTLQYN